VLGRRCPARGADPRGADPRDADPRDEVRSIGVLAWFGRSGILPDCGAGKY
jgi:hypothetical protein